MEVRKTNKSLQYTTHFIVWCLIVFLLVKSLSASGTTHETSNNFPRKPIKVVVPNRAGGGSDIIVRLFQKTITEKKLMPVPLIVLNRPGGSSTIGSRSVKNADADGYTLLSSHEGLLIAKSTGKVPYGVESFDPIAGTGIVDLVLLVKADSPFQNLSQLMQAVKEKPRSQVFGCSLGTPSHFSGLLLEQAVPGAQFNFVQAGGGSSRFEKLLGGHIDVSLFSISEYKRNKSKKIRALAFLGAKRLPSLPDLPTAIEQGIQVKSNLMFYWLYPKNTSQECIIYMANVFKKALQEESLQNELRSLNISPQFLKGEDLQERLDQERKKINQVKTSKIIELPEFHKIVLVVLAVLLIFIFLTSSKQKIQKSYSSYNLLAFSIIIITVLYALILGQHWIDFRLLTIGFIFIVGWLLSRKQPQLLLGLIELSLVIGLGLYYIFTEIVMIDL